jgi:hypothetical protein
LGGLWFQVSPGGQGGGEEEVSEICFNVLLCLSSHYSRKHKIGGLQSRPAWVKKQTRKLLGSGNPPALASPVAETMGAHHCT